ncbi:translocation protein [Clavulina sp. PMI_390]|nr:translocation protein [Clavulina sp. PMI_390]
MEHQKNAPPEILKVAQFLRSSKSGIKTRAGVIPQNGKRVDYFKGKAAIKAVMSPAYAKLKGVPPQPATEEAAIQLLNSMIPYAFFLRVERGGPSGGSGSPKQVQIVQQQSFQQADWYFAWLYEGSQWVTYLGGFAMVAVILVGVMFPLWPPIMRQGAYYLSLLFFALVGLFIVVAILRLILYVITVVAASPGIWLFPNLFADVGFVDSFIPVWDWDLPPKKKKKRSKDGKVGDKSEKIMNGLKSGISTGSEASLSRAGTPSKGSRIEEVVDDGSD